MTSDKQQQQERMFHYECNEQDRSITRINILQPYIYDKLISTIPQWLSANVITAIGFTCVFTCTMLCVIMCPTMTEHMPRWLLFTISLLLFAYQTADALDGMHARRTKSASALGDYLDHIVDSLVGVLATIPMICLCAQGAGLFSFLLVFATCIPFIFVTWEYYYDGCLKTGIINGPVEGQLSMQALYLVGTIFGHEFWLQPLSHFSKRLATFYLPFLANIPLIVIIASVTAIGLTCYSVQSVVNVYHIIQRNKEQNLPEETRSIKQETDMSKALEAIAPFEILFGGAVLWIIVSPANIMRLHPYLFIFSVGTGFSYLVSSMIMARIYERAMKTYSYTSCTPMILCVINCSLQLLGVDIVSESTSLQVYFSLALAFYLVNTMSVIYQFSKDLDVGLITINKETITQTSVS
jgi:phosphatidylglycerophosphate synthase